MQRAEKGMRSMPMFMAVIAAAFFMSCVMITTNRTTTAGFTLAIHSGDASRPTSRITYLGMVAYI